MSGGGGEPLTAVAMSCCTSLTAQGSVVDAHLIDQPGKPLAPDTVATQAQHARGSRHRTRDGRRARQRAIDVETHSRTVIGRRQMRPGVQRQRRRPDRIPLGADEHLPQRPRAGLIGKQPVHNPTRTLLEDHRPPTTKPRRPHPCLQRHPSRQIERARIRHRHPVVDPVEAQRRAKPTRPTPHRTRDRTDIPPPRGVGDTRARPGIKPVCRHQAGGSGGLHERGGVGRGVGRGDDRVRR